MAFCEISGVPYHKNWLLTWIMYDERETERKRNIRYVYFLFLLEDME